MSGSGCLATIGKLTIGIAILVVLISVVCVVCISKMDKVKKEVDNRIQKTKADMANIGQEVGRDGNAIFFFTTKSDQASFQKVIEYYKLRMSASTFRILFLDAKVSKSECKYPLSDNIWACWVAEYIHNEKTGLYELRYIDRDTPH